MIYPLDLDSLSGVSVLATPEDVQVADILFDDLKEALLTKMLPFYSDFLGSDGKT